MSKRLALIHTSLVFITKETLMSDLFAEIMPEVNLINIVDDSLLPETMTAGRVTDNCVERMRAYAQAAETAGADAILSLCSSLGPAIDEARKHAKIPIAKIDDAMTEAAVKAASSIAVMATVPTTLDPTCDLVREKAGKAGKAVDIKPTLVAGAFEKLMAGETEAHDQMVGDAAAEIKDSVELIVFAQASMTRLAKPISERIGIPILTSPRLGIEAARQLIDSL